MNTIDWNRELAQALQDLIKAFERAVPPGKWRVPDYYTAKRVLERYEAYGEMGVHA